MRTTCQRRLCASRSGSRMNVVAKGMFDTGSDQATGDRLSGATNKTMQFPNYVIENCLKLTQSFAVKRRALAVQRLVCGGQTRDGQSGRLKYVVYVRCMHRAADYRDGLLSAHKTLSMQEFRLGWKSTQHAWRILRWLVERTAIRPVSASTWPRADCS